MATTETVEPSRERRSESFTTYLEQLRRAEERLDG